MKITFQGGFIPAIDEAGEHEVVDSQLLHRFSLVNGEVVDKYPGKTDAEIMTIEWNEAKAANDAARAAWDEENPDAEDETGKPALLPELHIPDHLKED